LALSTSKIHDQILAVAKTVAVFMSWGVSPDGRTGLSLTSYSLCVVNMQPKRTPLYINRDSVVISAILRYLYGTVFIRDPSPPLLREGLVKLLLCIFVFR
jgi:hypothetical protein